MKTIRTVDVDASAQLRRWCSYSDKVSILVEHCQCQQTYSYFLKLKLHLNSIKQANCWLYFWFKQTDIL